MSGVLSAEQRRALDSLLDRSGIGRSPDRVARRTGDRGHAIASFGQERLHFMEQLYPGSPIYLVSGALRLRGRLNTEMLRRSIRFLVDRHETLRTGFSVTVDGITQVIDDAGTVHVDVPTIEVGATDVPRICAEIGRRGFDLTTPPLFRAALLHVRSAVEPEWVLVLAMHHIVVDGWSLGILLAELGVVYRALVAGARPELPALPVQYADFAVWQRETVSDSLLAEQLAVWRGRLASLPAVDLPVDRPRPGRRDYSGAAVPITVPRTAVEAVSRTADECRATLFMALAAALAVVIGRWAGDRDVVIGTPVAGRRRAELEGVVGFFVNTVPLRIQLSTSESFRTLVRRAREVCAEAYANQDVPYEQLVRELGIDRDVSGQSSLARYWLVMHNTPPLDLRLPGVECVVEQGLVSTVRCDLSFQLAPDGGGGLIGWLEYSTELYDRSTVERIATGLECVVAAAGARPDEPVATLPVMPAATTHWITDSLGRGPSGTTSHGGVVELFETQADRMPDAVAVVDDETAAPTSYRALDARANRIAHLLKCHGAGLEDRIGVVVDHGADRLPVLLGVLKAGAAYLPLDPQLPRQRLAGIVADARPLLLLTAEDHTKTMAGLGSPTISLADADSQPDHRRQLVSPAEAQAAYVLFTSGSTGRPKGVVGTVGGLRNRLLGMRDAYRVGPGDRVLQKAPYGFDVSLWELLLPVVSGATVVCGRTDGHRDADYLHAVIDRTKVSVCHFVPSMLQAFTDGTRHESLRVLLSGGEALPAALAERVLAEHPGVRLYNQYGPTEATIDVSAGELRSPMPANAPIGRPVLGAEIHILDEHLAVQPVGVPGQIHLGGVQLARGYLGAPQLTAAAFVPDPRSAGGRLYATGDRARWLPDGTIEFLGRMDRQLKVRGHRVEPGEIEAVLVRDPRVTDALVLPDGDGGLVGYVVTARPVETTGLADLLRAWLPRPLVPAHLVVLDRWPVGPHGKLDRAALPRPGAEPVPRPRPVTMPRTTTEHTIAGIFAELLTREAVGVEESFLDIGGHSLLAIRAVARIRTTLGVGMTIGQFFAAQTVAALATLVDASLRQPDVAPIRRIDRDHFRR